VLSPGPRTEPVKVLFVAGYGRSGSTLLDRVLGEVDGFCSVGELRHLFQEGYVENRRCGCGERFHDCGFWRRVNREAFAAEGPPDLEQLLALKRRVDRWWRSPQLGWGIGTARQRADVERYRAVLRRFYLAIRSASGARVIVDSSKDVSHGYALRGIGAPIEPHVLHLVRDSRAVAHSWQRHKFNPGNGGEMNRYSLVRTSAEWNLINALTALHRRTGTSYSTLRYRDFATDPARAVRGVLEAVGEGERTGPVSADGTVTLGENHTVAGNPNRFRRGELTIRPDEDWRQRMSPAAKALVTALTFPGLSRQGSDRDLSRG
jgi:Sulfotransferase family